jgi:hypothetical protein
MDNHINQDKILYHPYRCAARSCFLNSPTSAWSELSYTSAHHLLDVEKTYFIKELYTLTLTPHFLFIRIFLTLFHSDLQSFNLIF